MQLTRVLAADERTIVQWRQHTIRFWQQRTTTTFIILINKRDYVLFVTILSKQHMYIVFMEFAPKNGPFIEEILGHLRYLII